MAKRFASSARDARMEKKPRRTRRDHPIDYSDIPPLSVDQLRSMRRVGRPTLGTAARQLIAIRVDPEVLEQFRREAKHRRIGYQTLINQVLANHVGKNEA